MSKIQLSDFFRLDYLSTITAYINRLQSILDEYDVAIFMARKAICFYDALISNNEIENQNCRIVSSRIVYYNTLDFYRGKKIAVIDDVVVRGNSLNRVAKKLNEFGISADYYVAVCENRFIDDFVNAYNISIVPHIIYPRKDIYHFSSLITQYIEASMRTFNVDSPTYSINNQIEYTKSILDGCGAVHLSSGLQSKYGIDSRSIYFEYTKKADVNSVIDKVILDSILKIRFYCDDTRVIAVPFVLLPACDSTELNELYDLLISSDTVNELIRNSNIRTVKENKHKLISYFLSDALFYNFAQKFKLIYTRDLQNDILQFDRNMDDISSNHSNLLIQIMGNTRLSTVSLSSFNLTDYIRDSYGFISSLNPDDQIYEDSNCKLFGSNTKDEDEKLSRIAFSFSDLLSWLDERHTSNPNNFIYASSVIDIFVDMGFIVPAILHTNNNKTLRAYKMGEYSKLTKNQINSFIAMLNTYQNTLDQEFDKIEFEKLCVLYFKSQLKSGLFAEQSTFEEGCYCIAYSYYGPRLSNAETLYSTSKNSVFVTDLVENEILKINENGKYYITVNKEIKDDLFLNQACQSFALNYVKLKRVFLEHPYVPRKEGFHDTKEHWNQYVHTYNQFLTLLAIGNNIRDQILSLCAEIVMVTKIDPEMFLTDINNLNLIDYRRSLSGINSGLWKYWSYKGNALLNTLEKMNKYDSNSCSTAISVLSSTNCSDEVKSFLDDCGTFLYRAAYVINSLLILTKRFSYFRIDSKDSDYYGGSREIGESRDEKTLFDVGPYYYSEMKTIRKSLCKDIEDNYLSLDKQIVVSQYISRLNILAHNTLDKCDLYLETKIPTSRYVEDFLIIQSPSSCLPLKYKNLKPCNLSGISELTSTVVFSIFNSDEIDTILEEVIEATVDVNDCTYLLIHQKNNNFGYTQILDSAKGTCIQKDIKKLLEYINKVPANGKSLHVYQKNDTNLILETVKLKKQSKYDYNDKGSIYVYSIHTKKEVKPMATNNYGDIVFGDGSVVIEPNFGQTGDRINSPTSYNHQIDYTLFQKHLEEARMQIEQDVELSDDQKAEASIHLDAIEKEIKKENPKTEIIKVAINTLKKLKGSVEFIAAITTLVNFLGNTGILP